MNSAVRFNAPWSVSLKIVSAATLMVLAGIPLAAWFLWPHDGLIRIAALCLPPVILLSEALFIIRGYVLSGDLLLVRRLLWNTRLPLSDLISAEKDVNALSRNICTCGNTALFCYAGEFRNETVGPYRVYATDPERLVVLKFKDRAVVVSPENPDLFVDAIRELRL